MAEIPELRRLAAVDRSLMPEQRDALTAVLDAAEALAAVPPFPAAAYERWRANGSEADAITMDAWVRQDREAHDRWRELTGETDG